MNKSIRLYGFTKNDALVFTSMLALLSNKTNYHWRITRSGLAEVLVVDVNAIRGVEQIPEIIEHAKMVVTYGNRKLNDDYIVLTKPLRAATVLKCLSEITCAQKLSITHTQSSN